MQTIEETSIMVSLCNMTLSELLFRISDEFDKIWDEFDILVNSSPPNVGLSDAY